MRSLTYVQPGERTSCVGCHEHRMSAPPETKPLVLAMSRPPSRIAPGELGGRPFSYVAVVQPVLDRHCVRCHGGEKTEKVNLTGAPLKGFTQSYWALCGTNTNFREVRQAGFAHAPAALVPRFMQRNQVQTTAPGGEYGALGSGLMNLVRTNHYEARLTDAETRRLAAWIDCNAIFYGSFDPAEQAKQLAGETIPMPSIQ
jgi:cytochrome c553